MTLAVGLMSGTSADGVTAALVEIGARGVRLLRCKTTPYPPTLKRMVLRAPNLSAPELSRLNVALGEAFAAAALAISRGARPKVIGSHGQTVWHGPSDIPPNTFQIAEPSIIAERCGVTTVADFRPRDMAAGGQGAPLVPAFDLFLYGRGPLRAIVNIGGIANVSILGRGRLHSAFDTGPGNSLMDEAMRRASRGRRHFDRNGDLAAAGRVDEKKLSAMLSDPYLRKAPPKSLDRSRFADAFLDLHYPRMDKRALPDIMATLCELTARSLSKSVLGNSPGPLTEVLVSGGGALNRHLMGRLEALFAPAPVRATDFPVMAKEAVCFAWLAVRAVQGRVNSAPAATGSRGPRILGKIIPA
ncbi:MAG: anhydro-N-acetylmuramic acid kinase [Elusimicrobiota bacterium]